MFQRVKGQMKHLIISIGMGAALALTAVTQAKQNDNDNTSTTTVHRGSRGNSQAQIAPVKTQSVARSSAMRSQRTVSTAPTKTHTYRATSQFNGNATVRSSTAANARVRERHVNTTVRSNTTANARFSERHANTTVRSSSSIAGNARVRDRNARFNDQARVQNNVAVNRDQNFRNRNFSGNNATNIRVNRNRNVTVTNNWRGSRFSGQQYAAFRNYHRQWHNRSWWSSHYNRIIFVSGGWYFWNAGYWYPAWGYAPGAYYPYDGPIYGYGNLSPDQIVVEVQTQLQRDGYYAGPIDGVLGPMTRQAIAAFQSDNGLAITSTVDEPTLSTLGLS